MFHEGMKRFNETGDRAEKLQSYLDDETNKQFTGIASEMDNLVHGKSVTSNVDVNVAASALSSISNAENHGFSTPKPNDGHKHAPLEIWSMHNDADESKKPLALLTLLKQIKSLPLSQSSLYRLIKKKKIIFPRHLVLFVTA